MVALRQLEIPCYRGFGEQRGVGFSAIAQVIGRIAIPLLRQFVAQL